MIAIDVGLYMRMSTNIQENSIESQQHTLYAYAKARQMHVVKEYIDEGISGRKADKRPAFMQMIEDSKGGNFQAVLIYDSSRFARNLEESIVYKSLLKKNNVELISVTEPSLDEDTSLIADALLGAMNEMYSRKLSKTVRRGMDYKAQQGYSLGKPPYGYKTVDGSGIPVIVPNEAEIVRAAFDLFIGGKPSFSGVAKELNRMGARRRSGGYWEARDTKRILTKGVYKGDCAWKFDSPTPYKGKQEAIIDSETFEKAQLIINRMSKTKTRDNSTYSHWLSGIFRCGQCGRVMTFCSHPIADYFRCRGNLSQICKPTVQISIKKAEKHIRNLLDDVFAGLDTVDYTNIVLTNPLKNNTGALNEQIRKSEKRLERYSVAYSEGIDTLEEYKSHKKAITEEIEKLKNEIDIIEKNTQNDKTISEIRKNSDGVKELIDSPKATLTEKNNAVRQIINKIVYDKKANELTVFFIC